MIFLIIYGVILLALSLLLMGYYKSNLTIYLFDWVWVLYFGKMFALLFMKNDEPSTQEERQLLLEKERNEGMAPLIPNQKYLIYAILELANAFLICIELYYMSFGLFIMAQTIVFSAYLVYRKNKDIACYAYTSMLMIAGILSLAYNSQGNNKCYIGLIATLMLMVSNIMTVDYKEQFQRTYIYQNSKLIGFAGIIQFIFWIIVLIVGQFLNCSNPCGNKCSSYTKLDQTTTFFTNTFSGDQNGYLLIIFIILIVAGAPLQYLDNKLSQDKLFDKKQIVECLIYFPIQLWLFISGSDTECSNPDVTNPSNSDKTILEILSLVFFIIQWFIGIYLLFCKREQTEYEHIQEEEDSEIS